MTGAALILAGALLLVLAAAGLFRLPDALARQHAATKSVTLALELIVIGTALAGGDAGFRWRAGILLVLLLATLPPASHLLARAALRARRGADEPEPPVY